MLLAWAASPAVAQSGGVPEAIKYYETVAMMSSAVAADEAVGTTGSNTMQLNFSALGRDFDLKLEPHDPYAPGAIVRWVDDAGVVDEPATRGIFFRGRVEGDADSWVRLTLRGDALAGVVVTSEEVYFFEPAARFFGPSAASDTVAFRMSDVDTSSLVTACGARELPSFQRSNKGPHFGLREMLGDETATVAATGLKRAVIGLIADYEYFSKASHGATSAADLAEILNSVDGIYQSELGVTVQVGPTVVFTTQSDPFSATTMNSLLSEVGTYKNNNDNSPGQALYGSDLAHLFTGRNLDGGVIGIAYIGALCSSGLGVGVDEDFSTSLTLMTLLMAHEMGHNFGAPHDNQTGSACASEPGTYIMNPSISSSLQHKFSPCSKSKIAPVVNNASCLDNVGAGSPTPTSPPPPSATNTRPPTATRTPTPPALAAAFVSQSVPSSMTAGQQYSVSVRMRNTGTMTWTASASIRLGSVNPNDNSTWGMNRVALAGGDSIASGQEKLFTWTVTAPSSAGAYNFQWRMLREGVAWFGPSSTNVVVSVGAAPTRTATRTPAVPTATPTSGVSGPPNASFVSQTVPSSMVAGQQYSVSVTMRNTGGTTWTPGALFRLGAINPVDNFNWGMNRVSLAGGDSIAPNQQKTFTWTITAPSGSGTYNFQWRMVQDGVAWFGANSNNVAVTVSGGGAPNAAYVSQDVPTTMTAGQQYSVSVTMKNTGSTNWNAGTLYRLGAINPYDNFNWGMNRIALAGGDNIAPNQQKTFTWTVRAPATRGTYNFQWRMVQDGVAWFGGESANTVISVQ